jgi:anthranilate 1,2-dioxygenase small subunit
MTLPVEHRELIEDFLVAYAECLDEDRLKDWPEFFVADGCYRVLSRENVELGLEAPIIYHYSKGMLEDRVTALRDALTYEHVYTRHILSRPAIDRRAVDLYAARSGYAVYQTTEEGRTRLYSVGRYLDEIVLIAGRPLFRSRTVIVDTFAIHNLLAVPL